MGIPPAFVTRLKLPRIKFIWGASRNIQGRWFLGLFGRYDRVEGHREGGLAVSVRGILAWGAALTMAAWLGGAAALFFWWERNPYNLLGYTDALFLPLRRAEIRAKHGQALNTEGMDLWRAKKYHEAARLLRQGLSRQPQDTRARNTLAQYFVLLNQRTLALSLLEQGLTSEYPGRGYLRTMCDIAEQAEDHAAIIRWCERYRPLVPPDASDHRWLETKLFAALLAVGRPADALALAEGEPAWSEVAGEQRVIALLALQRPEEALQALAEWRGRRGDVRLVTRLQVRAFREAKRLDEMERAIEELCDLNPALPQPAVYGVVQRSLAGRTESARAALEDYLFRFAKSTTDLQLLAEPLAEIGDLPLLERCAEAAAERGYPAASYQILLVQTHVMQGNWSAAQEILQEMPEPAGRSAVIGKVWHTWMARLIAAAETPGGSAPAALLAFLRERAWPMQIFRKSSEAMRGAGRLEIERDIVASARLAFPASAWLQARLSEVERLIAARPLPPEVPVTARAAVATEARAEARRWTEPTFLARLDELLRDAKWDDAEDLISGMREVRPAPDWLARRDDVIRLARVRIGHGRGRRTDLLAAARLFLNGSEARSKTLLELARELDGRGDRETAVTLVQEVQRKTPGYPPARRLMAEWAPESGGK